MLIPPRPTLAVAVSLLALVSISSTAAAAEAIFRDLRVDKKPGQPTGPAVVTVGGEVKRISQNALQTWPIMNGENALILVMNKGKDGSPIYVLRFYDGALRKRRDLGKVSFSSAELVERTLSDGAWAFILSGQDGKTPRIVVTDTGTIHARLDGTVVASQDPQALTYKHSPTGDSRTVKLVSLLGLDMQGIFEAHDAADGKPHYVQFLREGSAVVVNPDGKFADGVWVTDGDRMTVRLNNGSTYERARSALTPVEGIPATTRLVVRMLQPLSSVQNHEGDAVPAVLVSPATIDGKILMPQGTELTGTLVKARAVGWAVKHETATLTVEFTSAKLPDSRVLPIHAKLFEVENSREKTKNGTIEGIRSTGTPGHTAESKIASVAALDPIAYLFTTVSATAILGFAEPEILYPAGTELVAELETPVLTSQVYPLRIPAITSTASEEQALQTFIKTLPFRTATKGSNKDSDITNLVFMGSSDAVMRALQAAGWVTADQLNARSTFETLKTISGNQPYNQAPMSVLLLDNKPPIHTITKTTNTFASRHHARIFDPEVSFNGAPVLTSSATQDIGIAFSAQQKTFIHVIDQYIDNERSKVVNDLMFTGCVTGSELVPRPWVPLDAYNSTGDRLRTDGAIAVLRINDCNNPKSTPTDELPPPPRFQRIVRDTMLVLRNDVWRGNLIYQGIAGSIAARNYFIHKDELKPDPGAWRKSDVTGTRFKGEGELAIEHQPSVSSTGAPVGPAVGGPDTSYRWTPPRYEIALQGGWLRYPHERFEALGVVATPDNPDDGVLTAGLLDSLDGGWTVGIAITDNTWRWVSNEFSYTYQRGKYEIGAFVIGTGDESPQFSSQRVGLISREFAYNVLVHGRRPESRWRPYVAIGPALQLMSLADTPLKRAPRVFHLGLQNVGVLLAAYQFGRTPPLEGGGVYQLGLQYGAGVKFRVHPRLTLRVDFRETLTRNPEFIKDSYTDEFFDVVGYSAEVFRVNADSKFRQQRFTFGFAFTF